MAPRNETPSEDWQVQYAEVKLRAAHLYRTREWADCTFQFLTADGSNSLEAHKLVLAMASPVFAAMFYGTVGDQGSPVTISDIDLTTFSTLLQYIYTDETDIPDVETAINLHKAANKYILVHLEKICLDYLYDHFNSNDVCQIYEFACLFGERELETKCLEMFSTETQLVLKGSGFCKAAHDTVKKIVSMDKLDIDSEVILFDALVEYLDKFKKTSNENAAHSIKDDMERLEFGQGDTHGNDPQKENESSENMALPSNNIFEEKRAVLKGLIEEIRFLSMSPAELAKIAEHTKVLSKHEIMTLFTNMFTPNVTPMPAGFSSIRKPRLKTQATIRFTLQNVRSRTVHVNYFSPPCYLRRLPWRIRTIRNKTPYGYYLGFYLDFDVNNLPSLPKDWSCKVKFECRLLSTNPNNAATIKSHEHIFSLSEEYSGWPKFINWSELTDPKNSFIKDDSITLEVHLIAEPVQHA
ncbi:BTB/POZ domain-containing protein [Phthorimaea operculella]|nr:BTB/POZ domain-containing protein [Phthorimaea operculella]